MIGGVTVNKTKIKKISNVALNVLVYVFMALCIVAVIVTVFFPKSSDGAQTVFGYQFRLVTTGSMERSPETNVSGYAIKSIPQNSIVFIETVPDDPAEAADWYENEVQIGDVLTFKYLYERQIVITHRVVDKYPNPEGEGYVIVLEGDNKSENTNQNRQVIYTADEDSLNYIIGKVQGKSYIFGLFIGAMKTPQSLVLLIVLPCLAIIVMEVVKIFKVVNADKREQALVESAKKDEEILDLKNQLEILKRMNEANGARDAPNNSASAEAEPVSSTSAESDSENSDGEMEDHDVT